MSCLKPVSFPRVLSRHPSPNHIYDFFLILKVKITSHKWVVWITLYHGAQQHPPDLLNYANSLAHLHSNYSHKQFDLGSKRIIRQFWSAGVTLHWKGRCSILQSHKDVSILRSLSGPTRHPQRALLQSSDFPSSKTLIIIPSKQCSSRIGATGKKRDLNGTNPNRI